MKWSPFVPTFKHRDPSAGRYVAIYTCDKGCSNYNIRHAKPSGETPTKGTPGKNLFVPSAITFGEQPTAFVYKRQPFHSTRASDSQAVILTSYCTHAVDFITI